MIGQQSDHIARLCNTIEKMSIAYFSSQTSSPVSITSVAFPVFKGGENEDVHEFIDNYKRAAHLSGWSPDNLATGLFLYLRGNAAVYMRTLLGADEMSFDDLASALVKRFASGATNWRLRQTLAERVQLENESVADYAGSLRKLFARLNLLRSEWMHKFVLGLKKEISEYIILQQPGGFEKAEELVF